MWQEFAAWLQYKASPGRAGVRATDCYNPTSQFLWRFWEASATHNLCVLQVTVTASKNQVVGDLLGVCHGLLHPHLVCRLQASSCLQTSGICSSPQAGVGMQWSGDPTGDIQTSRVRRLQEARISSPGCAQLPVLSHWKLMVFPGQQYVHTSCQGFPGACSPAGTQAKEEHD